MRRQLQPGQPISVRCTRSGKQARARVVGQLRDQGHRHVFGIALLEEQPGLWGIDFAALDDAGPALLRVLLECTGCHGRKMTGLNEVEAEIYAASHHVSRQCTKCGDWTNWKTASHQPTIEDTGTHRRPKTALRARNERRHPRIALNMSACIRHEGLGEETVQVENLSRGGLLFKSAVRYKMGAWIEVAAPYTPGAANVFVPARIVRCQELAGGNLRKYGVEYMKDFDRKQQEF